jgi:ATP-dependent protease ClpP protease subunit
MAKTERSAAAHPAIEVRALGEGSLELLMYGEIGGYAEDRDERICAAKVARVLSEARGVQSIHLRINSPGGDAFEGVAIHNLLAQHPARIEVDIDAYALSAASLIAMAGDHIRMADNALMMVHDPWTVAVGNGEDLLETAAKLDKMADVMARTYAARCGQPVEDVRRMMAAETWLTADDALAAGFCDEVREPAVRMAACALTDETLARFRAAPDQLRSLLSGDEETAAPPTDTVSAEAQAPAMPGNDGDPMDNLLKALGVKSEAEACVVVAERERVTAAVLAATETKDIAAALASIEQLKAQATESVKLAARLASLEADTAKRERETVIARMSESGKLPPSLHDWARSLSAEQLAVFEAAAPAAKAPAAPPVANSGEPVLSEEDERLIRAHGTDRAAFIAQRKRELSRKASA